MIEYHNRPDATEETMFIDKDGLQWLRTGDIGKVDEQGYLYIVDRKKDMILSGGQNIYPADIESVIIQHPAVSEVAVIGIPDEKWGESPLALVVLTQGAAPQFPSRSCCSGPMKTWANGSESRALNFATIYPVIPMAKS